MGCHEQPNTCGKKEGSRGKLRWDTIEEKGGKGGCREEGSRGKLRWDTIEKKGGKGGCREEGRATRGRSNALNAILFSMLSYTAVQEVDKEGGGMQGPCGPPLHTHNTPTHTSSPTHHVPDLSTLYTPSHPLSFLPTNLRLQHEDEIC